MAAPVVAAAAAPVMSAKAAALLGAGTGAAQGLISSAFNMFEAGKNRKWQERMSNTAHQREVQDLRKAGLNPILSAKHGGAPVTGGASAQASSPDVAASTLGALNLRSQIALQAAQADQASSAAGLSREQTADITTTRQGRIDNLIASNYQALQAGNLSGEQMQKIKAEILNLEAQRKLISSQAAHSAEQLHREKLKSVPFQAANEALEKGKNWVEKRREKVKAERKSEKRVHPIWETGKKKFTDWYFNLGSKKGGK